MNKSASYAAHFIYCSYYMSFTKHYRQDRMTSALVSIPLFSPELMDEYPQISQFNTHTQASLIVSMHPDLLIVGRMHAT